MKGHNMTIGKISKYLLVTFIYFLSSLPALASIISVNPDGTVNGQPIHVTKNYAYYNCKGIVSEQLIEIAYEQLIDYSNAMGVAPPQNDQCVVSQGLPSSFVPYMITLNYFVSPVNSMCFYKNHCLDSRDMGLFIKDGKLYFNYMIVNAAESMTRQMCVTPQGEVINSTGCGSM